MSDSLREDGEPQGEQDVVGYGRPPRHSRFKSGHSGNAKGRPRGKRNMAKLLDEVLAQRIPVTSNGKRKRVSVESAVLMRLVEKALGGDLKATAMLLGLRAVHLPGTEEGADYRVLLTEDHAILVSAGFIAPEETAHDQA
jgi:hypothetical protein